MPTFYSSNGNPEVWAKKPKGYFTEEEWKKAHPDPEPTPPTEEELAVQVRSERNYLLQLTDKYLLPDFPISDHDLGLVKKYRSDLRQLPKQEGFPSNITWPKNPMEA